MKKITNKMLQASALIILMLAGSAPGWAVLTIEKATNGFDADVAPGPDIIEGSPVTWTYVVTNVDLTGTGREPTVTNVSVSDDQGVIVTCPNITTLTANESVMCMGSGIATLGAYENTGMATGDSSVGNQSASDDSHYNGIPVPSSGLLIETLTNGLDSDSVPGATLTTGDAVTWSYEVTNTGGTSLANIVVSDDQSVSVSCPGTTLAVGTNMTCTGSGTVIDGQYMNTGSVTGEDPSGTVVMASDPSHYLGFCAISVEIVKKTNGIDVTQTPGDNLTIGDPVTWEYQVTNTSACNLLNVAVTDDQGVAVSCPLAILAAGEVMVCTGQGTVTTVGQYTNIGTVTASDRLRNQIQEQDASYYFGLAAGATLAAVAGPDQNIDEGAAVALDGTGSVNPVTFAWEQIAGPDVSASLLGETTATPTFDTPYITSASATITFKLTVTDGVPEPENEGDPIPETASDTVDITVVNTNIAPVADAGDDITAKLGNTAMLDGSGSFDNEGDAINYSWIQVAGNSVSLSDNALVNPSFTTSGAAGDTFVFQLTVDDGKESSIPQPSSPVPAAQDDDLVVVTVVANSVPIADAGIDQSVDEDTPAALNGSASIDPDGDILSYEWEQTSGPTVMLSDVFSATPTFQAPVVNSGGETLVFELTVTDDDIFNPLSSVDSVTINILDVNDPPNCSLAAADPASFWPPNHKMKSVAIIGVTDIDGDEITVTVNSVTQDEPTNGLGDGDTSPDAVIQAADEPTLLRTERSGSGDGRIYTINFTASDGSDSCSGSVQVGVPHSRKSTAVDSGQNYDSTQ